ncbi:hypothetical protein CONLIGDRAFT_670475 [Coniochaeta ligniaria NRRL 30616]|uniref:Heterokaryon incompatibility domain-containing protein n=1 Tax=Coniochaeta ligniaria NRRL 30616 TaxID=1408157 RepID=A0A1J7J5Y1_9PEZI|nr:hypothetical protein CONLIGDRAFT_670475 [Coniochaeta ligniaria NRRL 30616]
MDAIFQTLRTAATEFLTPLIDRRENYIYNPLPSTGSFRLLSFGTEDSSHISITLETFELADAPPYQALSYCCGSPFDVPIFELPDLFIGTSGPIATSYGEHNKKPIVCNGQRLYIGKNLKEFFDRLRGDDYAQLEHKHLWVDAVCISQDDLAEKSAQILRMGDIYQRASSVIVWLGDSLPETSLALDVLEELSKIPMRRLQEMQRLPITSDTSYDTLGIRRISERERRAFVGFSRRAYFNRVWVVQEAVFARRLTFLCGEFQVSTETLFDVSKMLILSGWGSQILQPYIPQLRPGSGPQVGAIAAVSQMAGDLERRTVRPLEILSSMRSRQASKPLDNIYPLLNLIAKALDKEPWELPVKPDYEAELAEVLEQTTLMCIRSSGDLTILPAVQERSMRGSAFTPSWVVDWTVPLAPVPLVTIQLINGLWNPSNGLPLELPDTAEPGILKFGAARVCTVESVSLETEQMTKDMDLSSLVDLVLEMDLPYGADTGQGLTEVLWRTVIADIAWDQHPAPDDFGLAFVHDYIGMVVCRTASFWSASNFETELELMVQQIDRLRAIDPASVFPDGDEVRRLARALKGDDANFDPTLLIEMMSKVEALGEHMSRVCLQRRLARTDFNLLAMVPKSTVAGDSIWLVPGLKTPFVFREMANGNLELVGEAYVHGIMFGEAMGSSELSDVRLQ